MNNIPLQSAPNQTFTLTLNGARFDISIIETKGVMSVSVLINSIPIIQNVRATASTFVLPYLYEEENGNFLFFNLNEELIYYPNFGVSQSLFWFSPGDLAYLRGTNGS